MEIIMIIVLGIYAVILTIWVTNVRKKRTYEDEVHYESSITNTRTGKATGLIIVTKRTYNDGEIKFITNKVIDETDY